MGFTYIPPTSEDRHLSFIDELLGRLVTLLGGRAVEVVLYSGRVSTGAFDDIRRATNLAYKAVAEYGLNETIGPVSLSTLSGGGFDGSGGSAPWGRDQVLFFNSFSFYFFFQFSLHERFDPRLYIAGAFCGSRPRRSERNAAIGT